MAKIEITRTELVWPGKYDEGGNRREVPRVSLPFQVIETVNETRATREAQKAKGYTLFDTWQGKEGSTFEDGWRNKLIWGDNLLVMGSLLERFAGKIDLIYIDPPFHSGADFSFTATVGDHELTKEPSILEEKAYRDTWASGVDSYLRMLHDRLVLMRDLLSPRGSLFVHLDWHVGHFVRHLLDAVFGAESFRNEVIWYYYNRFAADGQNFGRKHDNIYWYSKGLDVNYSPIDEPREEAQKRLLRKKHQGRAVNVKDDSGALVYYEQTTRRIDDVWRMPLVPPASSDYTGYGTQKPVELVSRILAACAPSGTLVADLFCGSGTSLVAAEQAGLRWIGCDLGRYAIHTARKRLLDIPNCKPFEILNLGKYERQYWQGVTFADKKAPAVEKTLFEYLAFILKLYGAQPVTGMAHLHGKRGKAMVHVGAVDAPVTIDEVNAAIAECLAVKQTELHVLGWEWEMGLNDLMVGEAKKRGVKLLLLQIPREVMEQQAVDKGDIRFFELAYLDVEIKTPKKLTAQIKLKEFVIPNTELIPEEVRKKVRKWSDYIDYWAVDWDFRNDTFMQGWVTYRTRKDRSLDLQSEPHAYAKAGKYRVLVKVVDIFGNDTSQAYDVEVA
jgi:DNA modification methylase